MPALCRGSSRKIRDVVFGPDWPITLGVCSRLEIAPEAGSPCRLRPLKTHWFDEARPRPRSFETTPGDHCANSAPRDKLHNPSILLVATLSHNTAPCRLQSLPEVLPHCAAPALRDPLFPAARTRLFARVGLLSLRSEALRAAVRRVTYHRAGRSKVWAVDPTSCDAGTFPGQ